ncbi:MAG: hypothetical protein ACLGGX_08075 [Bdellovibrionia bacterium]
MQLKSFLIVSIALHLALVAAETLLIAPELFHRKNKKETPVLIEFSLDNSETASNTSSLQKKLTKQIKSHTKNAMTGNNSKVPHPKAFLTNSLKTGLTNQHFADFHSQQGIFSGANDPRAITGSGAWVEKMSFQEGLELTGLLKKVHDTLNEGILYPEDFLKMRLKGNVQLDFYINHKGQMVGRFAKVSSGNFLLSLYTQAMVLKLLETPMQKNLWGSEGQNIPITLHVEFTPQAYDINSKFSSYYENNNITLVRKAFIQPQIFEKIERVMTRYYPPIIPVPGGFYVDFIRLVEFIKNNSPNAIDPEERLEQRVELDREILERFVHQRQEEGG